MSDEPAPDSKQSKQPKDDGRDGREVRDNLAGPREAKDTPYSVVPLGPKPQIVSCPHCGYYVTTAVNIIPSAKTHFKAILMCICCLCFIPYICPICMNVDHFCPECENYIGFFTLGLASNLPIVVYMLIEILAKPGYKHRRFAYPYERNVVHRRRWFLLGEDIFLADYSRHEPWDMSRLRQRLCEHSIFTPLIAAG